MAALVRPLPVLQISIALVAGAVIGVMQARSLQQAPSTFRMASTASQVRRAFTSTASGKWAQRIQWAAELLVGGVTIFSRTMPAGISQGLAWGSGLAVLFATSDLVSLRGRRGLARAQGGDH